jgi:hypothetical protein
MIVFEDLILLFNLQVLFLDDIINSPEFLGLSILQAQFGDLLERHIEPCRRLIELLLQDHSL